MQTEERTTPINHAAYLTTPRARPLSILPAPLPTPGPNEIVIQTAAIAINPVDWIVQDNGTALAFPWLKYPLVVGCDVAGSIISLGPSVTRFKPGDRVIGLCLGTNKERSRNSEAAFQEYVLLSSDLATRIPDNISYESASVIPLGLGTAAAGLFEADQLHISLPSNATSKLILSKTSTEARNKAQTILVWGASTSVGLNAIQLARASGYTVIATCSPHNFSLIKSLGAQAVFDYNSPSAITSIASALSDTVCVGAISIGAGAAEACFSVLHTSQLATGSKKFVSMATFPLPSPMPQGRLALPIVVYKFISWSIVTWIKSKLWGIKYAFIAAGSIANSNIGQNVFGGFLESALEEGGFIPSPEPMIVEGRGLEVLQRAMDVQKKGVSARKVVVRL